MWEQRLKVKKGEVEKIKQKNKMSKYNLNDIFEEMSQKDKDFDSAQAMDRLTKDDQDKLKMLKMMMDKEKSIENIKRMNPKANEKSLKKLTKMEEARVDRDVAERIEGMLSIPLKKKFLDSFMDLWQDLIEEDPFYAEDVINHLNNEMHKEIDGYQSAGDRLAGLEEDSNANSNYGSNEGSNENSNDNPATNQSYSGLEKFRQGVNEIDIDSVSNDPGSGDADNPTGEELESGGGYDAAMEEDLEPNMYIDDDEFEMEMVIDRAKEIAPILKGVDMDIITDFVKTHRQDIRGASDDDIRDEFQEFISVNYDSVNEMENLKEHFNRFK